MQAKASQEKSRGIVRNVWIALFRGINVGGHNLLPMRELTALLGKLGARDVKTYIQSGNAVFQHASDDASVLAQRITRAIDRGHGFAPRVLLLTRSQLEQAAAANPFLAHASAPSTVHLVFLASDPPQPNVAGLNKLKSATESFVLAGDRFYLHAPDGLARSKLASGVERLLGVEGTARNWRTVGKLLELAKAAS